MTNNVFESESYKRLVLSPIVEDWNRVIGEDWKVVDARILDHVLIVSETKTSIHGKLLTDIAGICNAYNWAWAVYIREGKVEVNI